MIWGDLLEDDIGEKIKENVRQWSRTILVATHLVHLAPTIVSLGFPVSLIVAQFTIFGSFRVLNFRSRFEALNDVFSALNGHEDMSPFWTWYLLFMDVVLKQIFLTMYHVRQTEVVC